MSDIAKLLFEMRERPHDFAVGRHTLQHLPTGQEFWIANGFWHYGLYRPHQIGFGFADKVRFKIAFRKFRKLPRIWLRHWLCETAAPLHIKAKVKADS